MMTRPTPPLVTILCVVVALNTLGSVMANPTGREPSKPLAAHGTIAESKEIVNDLYQLYHEEEKFVIETYAKKDNPTRFSDRQISKAAGRLWKARRDAERLKLMGEPAGDDLAKQLVRLAVEVDKFGLAYRGTPKGAQLVQRYTQQLNREKPRFAQFLQKADAAIDRGQLEAVEAQLEAKGVNLYEKLVYFSPSARKPYNQLFYQVLGKNDNLLEAKRKQEYQQRATDAIAQNNSGMIPKLIQDELSSWFEAPVKVDGTHDAFEGIG